MQVSVLVYMSLWQARFQNMNDKLVSCLGISIVSYLNATLPFHEPRLHTSLAHLNWEVFLEGIGVVNVKCFKPIFAKHTHHFVAKWKVSIAPLHSFPRRWDPRSGLNLIMAPTQKTKFNNLSPGHTSNFWRMTHVNTPPHPYSKVQLMIEQWRRTIHLTFSNVDFGVSLCKWAPEISR